MTQRLNPTTTTIGQVSLQAAEQVVLEGLLQDFGHFGSVLFQRESSRAHGAKLWPLGYLLMASAFHKDHWLSVGAKVPKCMLQSTPSSLLSCYSGQTQSFPYLKDQMNLKIGDIYHFLLRSHFVI